jgi:hypothetical protein
LQDLRLFTPQSRHCRSKSGLAPKGAGAKGFFEFLE